MAKKNKQFNIKVNNVTESVSANNAEVVIPDNKTAVNAAVESSVDNEAIGDAVKNEPVVTAAVETANPVVPETPAAPITPTPSPVVQNLTAAQPAKPVVQSNVQQSAAKPTEQSKASSSDDFMTKIQQMKLTGTSEEKNIIGVFELYIENMKPGRPVTGDRGAHFQYTLWRMLFNILHNIPQSQFKQTWNIVLGFFKEYANTVFDDRYVFRFAESWSKNEDELKSFQRLVDLIKLTAEPSTRVQNLRQIDLDAVCRLVFSDEARNRLVSFYKR